MGEPLDPNKFKNLPPHILERLNRQRAQTEAEIAQMQTDFFKMGDRVSGALNPDGTIIPQAPIGLPIRISKGTHTSARLFNIYEYTNGHGNTVYLVSHDETDETQGTQKGLKALSDSINAQKAEFQSLDSNEKAKQHPRPQLFGKPEGRFGAYLRNEALGDLFKKLK